MGGTNCILYRLFRLTYCRLGWTADIFDNSDDAEADLCADRAAFVMQAEIQPLIPRDIWMRLIHSGDNAQIEGFRELFIHLNTDPDADELRRLIMTYFKNTPALQGHLS